MPQRDALSPRDTERAQWAPKGREAGPDAAIWAPASRLQGRAMPATATLCPSHILRSQPDEGNVTESNWILESSPSTVVRTLHSWVAQ